MNATTVQLPLTTRLSMLLRLMAVQASWNYESMMGTGIAWSLEPALRGLPGGAGGERFRAAVARNCRYFNANPYLAALAVGALARAELDGSPVADVARFRTAVCGPLGSVGDRLVWAGWLPFCSVLALGAFGLGAGPLVVVLLFLAVFNAGTLWLRLWSLAEGWRHGLGIAAVLAHPVFRRGPTWIAQGSALVAGCAVPLAVARLLAEHPAQLAVAFAVAGLWALVTAFVAKRADGFRAALIGLTAFAAWSLVA